MSMAPPREAGCSCLKLRVLVVVERFGNQAAVLLHQFFDALFRFFESLLACAREFDAPLKRLQRIFERLIAGFHLSDDFFELRQGGLEIRHLRFLRHEAIFRVG
jgi:hypothetical protein